MRFLVGPTVFVLAVCTNHMGDSNDKPRSNNGASLANEPRFAKALTDRRFAKIKHKDRSIVIDKRFKNILENRNFALAGAYPCLLICLLGT